MALYQRDKYIATPNVAVHHHGYIIPTDLSRFYLILTHDIQFNYEADLFIWCFMLSTNAFAIIMHRIIAYVYASRMLPDLQPGLL